MVRGPAALDPGPMSQTPLPPDSPDPDPGAADPDPDEQPTTQAPADGAAPRRLLRARDDRVIAGVCSGLARYFRIDPIIVRIAAVALVFVGGAGVIAYLAAWMLVPEDDGTGQAVPGRPSRMATIAGAGALVLAGIALLDNWWGFHSWAFGSLVPLVVVGVILAVVGNRILRNRGDDQPTAARIAGAALVVCGGLVGAFVLALGAAWATAAGGGAAVAAVVIALGVAMIGLSFRTPRARWLALPALVLAIPAGVVSAAGIDADGGIGQRTYRPATVADLKPGGYELGTGELVVDLRDMQWPSGDPVSVKLDVGIGHALVLVPRDVCVQSTAHVGLGYIGVLGAESGGADIDDEQGTLARATGPQLRLDADMGIGAVEVRHRRGYGDHRGFRGRDSGEYIDDALADAGCAGERA
jgi:phage shock protein PspC (stress-responsive transcriptional regulator)